MNRKEKQLLVKFLEDHVERLGNDGCNDFDFPDNWSVAEQLKFSKKVAPDFYDEMNAVGASEDDIPLGSNVMVLDGLINLLKVELKLDTDQD